MSRRSTSASLRPSWYATQLTSMRQSDRGQSNFFCGNVTLDTIAPSEEFTLTPGPMPDLSRRAASLGTENAFVVLAEVNELARQGRDIISFCIGQADFPAQLNVQEAAIRALREGKHGYTPSAGIDPLREAAAKYLAGMRGGLPIRAEDVVIGAGAKPLLAYAILSSTDHGA